MADGGEAAAMGIYTGMDAVVLLTDASILATPSFLFSFVRRSPAPGSPPRLYTLSPLQLLTFFPLGVFPHPITSTFLSSRFCVLCHLSLHLYLQCLYHPPIILLSLFLHCLFFTLLLISLPSVLPPTPAASVCHLSCSFFASFLPSSYRSVSHHLSHFPTNV